MVNENSEYSILEYLQKNGATNTFKLAHVLEIKRDKLLGILKNLEGRGLIKIVTGKVEFLSYPSKERAKKKPKVSKKSEIEKSQEEIENQKLYIEKLEGEIKKLKQRPPKVITRTIIKEVEPIKVSPPKPIKTKRKKKEKREKIKEAKTKPKKIVKRSVKLRKKTKKIEVKKSFKSFKRLIAPKIRGGLGIFKIKNFIRYLKRR